MFLFLLLNVLQVDAADGILVMGTSLEVYSAFRLVKRAADRGVPVVIVNKGETRAERSEIPLARKIEHSCAVIMKQVDKVMFR